MKNFIFNLFNSEPLLINYNKKQIRKLFVIIIFSHSFWLGIWIFYRLKDLWLLYSEKLYTLFNLTFLEYQMIQFSISFCFGLLMALFLFCIILLLNKFLIIKKLNKYNREKISSFEFSCYQLSFSPIFNILLIIVSIITETRYYDRGFIFYPFLMGNFYIFWMAFMLHKILIGIFNKNNNRERIDRKIPIYYCLIGAILFNLLFLIVPYFFKGSYGTLYSVIW